MPRAGEAVCSSRGFTEGVGTSPPHRLQVEREMPGGEKGCSSRGAGRGPYQSLEHSPARHGLTSTLFPLPAGGRSAVLPARFPLGHHLCCPISLPRLGTEAGQGGRKEGRMRVQGRMLGTSPGGPGRG